ncbi:C45 family autoproteolytic acyltransferase/hydolase [Hyalangium versicolor]|uniref:C45 family autoproteolytic acyltransferase/hydolase n=1 Tax=Hyalangium versicolor TaxID=2861190 RepID=UPI001CCD696D|nr:C45 family autoproteolytic acyltransferase/hydolase [Hyalangium versicolor]
MLSLRPPSGLLTALLAALGVLAATTAAAAQVPVANASFETAAGSGAPTGWSVSGQGQVSATSTVHAEGNRSLSIQSPPGGAETTVQSEPLKLQVGRLYRLSAWVRTRGVQADPTARYPTAVGACLSMKSFPFTNCSPASASEQGGRVSVMFFASQSTDQVQVHLGRNGKATGSAWFDDVRLEEVDDITAYTPLESVRWADKGFRYDEGGWIYVHIEGEPYERGRQFGELVSQEIVRYMEKLGIQKDKADAAKGWAQVRLLTDSLFLRKYDPEYLEEMRGIADGANKGGAKFKERDLDLLDIVSLNSAVDLSSLESANTVTATPLSGRTFLKAEEEAELAGKGDHCSSFVATKSATPDGRFIMGQLFMWNGYTGVHWDVVLDVQPTHGHRFVMQTFPGGIHSGADWFINDAGIVIGETTVGQTPFNSNGTPQSNRIRKAAQYASSIDDVARLLKDKNNGLYTNDWTLADAKTDEGACFLLGTNKTRLWRTGSKTAAADTPGNLKDFIWANNNNRDIEVRKESVPNPNNAPVDLAFNTWNRDIAFWKFYEQYGKGGVTLDSATRMMASSPITRPHACDGKVTTSEMTEKLMFLAHYGKPTLRENMVGSRFIPDLPGATPRLSLGYTTFSPLVVSDKLKAAHASAKPEAEAQTPKRDFAHIKDAVSFDEKLLWANTVYPTSDGDNWLVSGSAAYWNLLKELPEGADKADKAFEQQRDALAEINSRYLTITGREGDLAAVAARTSYNRYGTYLVPRIKGTFALHQLRLLLGNKVFSQVMTKAHERFANRNITTADFIKTASEVSGKDLRAFITQWVERSGLPQPRIQSGFTKAKDGYDVKLKVEQPGSPYHFITSVEVWTEKARLLERVEVKGSSDTFTFHTSDKPVRLVFNPAADVPVRRERYFTLSQMLEEWDRLLFVYGSSRQVESERTLAMNYRDVVADVSMDVLPPLKPDAEVTDQELAEKDLIVFGGAEDNTLVARLAAEKKLPVEIGRRFFRWQGKTYGRSDDGLALAVPNPWNPQRVLYLYLANSAVELWHMTHSFQRGMQSWALYRGGEVSTKGFHDLDALSQDLKEAPPPVVNQPAL